MIKDDICNLPSLPPQNIPQNPEYNVTGDTCRPQNIVSIQAKSVEENNKPNEIQIVTSNYGGCLEYKQLLELVNVKAKELRGDFNQDDVRMFTNEALEDLWNMNEGSVGWNWTLRDYQIVLDGDTARYRLPSDFNGISGVSFSDTQNGKVPSKGYFTVVEAHQWDSVQFGNYVMYRYEDDGIYLYVRTRNMDCWCCNGLKLKGSIYLKYYSIAPRVEKLEDKICGIPVQWGIKTILADMIARNMYAAKGKPYAQNAGLQANLTKLMKLDRGQPLKDNLYKSQPLSFKIMR